MRYEQAGFVGELNLEKEDGVDATHEGGARPASLRAGGARAPRSGSCVLASPFLLASLLLSVDVGDFFNHDPLIPVCTSTPVLHSG